MILPHISRQKVYKNVQQKTLVLEITSLFSMAAGHEKGVKRDDFGLLDVKKRIANRRDVDISKNEYR